MKKIICLVILLSHSLFSATSNVSTMPLPLIAGTNLMTNVMVDSNGNPVYLKSKTLDSIAQPCCNQTEIKECGCRSCCAYGWSFLIKQGYFYPQEKCLRDIFQCAGSRGGYYLEADMRYNFCKGFNIEIDGSYFSHKGCSVVYAYDFVCSNTLIECQQTQECGYSCGDPVCFKAPAIGFGLKYIYDPCCWLGILIGGGFKVFFVSVDTQYPFIISHQSSYAPGFYVQTGLQFNPCGGLLIEVFADYMYGRMCSNSSCCSNNYKVNVGGFATGVGLGYKF